MTEETRDKLLDAALLHVAFDGWSEKAFKAAAADAEIDMVLARSLFPRGAVDLAVAYHLRGDALMAQRMASSNLEGMRYRDKVAFAVRARIEAADDREAVRRGTALFALPIYALEGAKLIWGTADAIWCALGDTSKDVNWYTKRATLAGVYSSTVLYWLGDDSMECQATWAFLDRRIEDVMKIEQAKAAARNNKLFETLSAFPNAVLSRVTAPMPKGPRPGGF